MRVFAILLVLSATPLGLTCPVLAQTATKPADPKVAAAQSAFEALPEDQRRAIQNDLTWATDYSGAALGTFGKLTFDAIAAFEKKAGGPADSILDAAQRQKLSEAANKARATLGFRVVEDPNTGSGIGLATKLMGKPEKAPAGTKWSSGSDIVLETVRTKPDKADMPATFDRFVNAVVEGRKVTYKLLRADFFVVSGEMGTQKFYTRFAPTPDGLRGYTITYNPKFSPDVERLVIATANTFEPIMSSPNMAGVAAPAKEAPANPAGQSTTTLAVPAALPVSGPAQKFASALIVAKGVALVPSSAVAACKSVSINGKAAQISDAGDGFSSVAVEGLEPVTLNLSAAGENEAATAFGFGSDKKLQAAPGQLQVNSALFKAALQPGLQGGAILSATGALRGIILDDPSSKPQINGVTLAANVGFSPSAKLVAILEKQHSSFAKGDGAALSTGELAQIATKMVASVVCQLR